jgi:hypothetical protein
LIENYDSFILELPTLKNEQILSLLKKADKPNQGDRFPKNSIGRSFQFHWLAKYPWLYYSKKLDSVICLSCFLFSSKFPHKIGTNKCFLKEPFSDWKNATHKFNLHESGKNGKKKLNGGIHCLTSEFLAFVSV